MVEMMVWVSMVMLQQSVMMQVLVIIMTIEGAFCPAPRPGSQVGPWLSETWVSRQRALSLCRRHHLAAARGKCMAEFSPLKVTAGKLSSHSQKIVIISSQTLHSSSLFSAKRKNKTKNNNEGFH